MTTQLFSLVSCASHLVAFCAYNCCVLVFSLSLYDDMADQNDDDNPQVNVDTFQGKQTMTFGFRNIMTYRKRTLAMNYKHARTSFTRHVSPHAKTNSKSARKHNQVQLLLYVTTRITTISNANIIVMKPFLWLPPDTTDGTRTNNTTRRINVTYTTHCQMKIFFSVEQKFFMLVNKRDSGRRPRQRARNVILDVSHERQCQGVQVCGDALWVQQLTQHQQYNTYILVRKAIICLI
eukprot:TRINITY_DN4002_c0_g1_i10.p1 TRINITY_DN4002_c0_g1~~TRINITY_DN4002_c0_g1_i10.p1  ORF type:complete len:235 (-),score=-8.80 TRINITY_DN4002_c0_g1_i10:278-982(-)